MKCFCAKDGGIEKMPKGEKSIREMIRGDLIIQLQEIWRKSAETYHEMQKGDNIQGTQHCKAVEINLGKLVPDQKKRNLKPLSLFLLSASACLHDIGKVVNDDNKGWQSDHGRRSAEMILNNYEMIPNMK